MLDNPLDLRELLTGDVNRLRHITRYSTNPQIHRESVAEHCYYVALYGLVISFWVNDEKGEPDIDELKVLRRCLTHDLDETRTGDFQRPFKYRRPELREMLNEVAEEELKDAVAPIFSREDTRAIFTQYMASMWRGAKDETYEGRIVEFADFLSVLSHMAVNATVLRDFDSMIEYAKTFLDPRFDFLRPIVDQALVIAEEITRTHIRES